MAYISTAEVKNIRNKLKEKFPQFKFSVSGGNSLKLHVSIVSGPEDFSEYTGEYKSFEVNQYHLGGYGKFSELFAKIYDVMKSENWYDKSDSMSDYFNTAYYMSLSVGKWNKPYEQKVK